MTYSLPLAECCAMPFCCRCGLVTLCVPWTRNVPTAESGGRALAVGRSSNLKRAMMSLDEGIARWPPRSQDLGRSTMVKGGRELVLYDLRCIKHQRSGSWGGGVNMGLVSAREERTEERGVVVLYLCCHMIGL